MPQLESNAAVLERVPIVESNVRVDGFGRAGVVGVMVA